MTNIHDALTQRIAADLGNEFLICIEEQLTAKFAAANNYVAAHYGQELRSTATGQLQHFHIIEEMVSAAKATGLAAAITATDPQGHYYAKIETECLVIGCMRMKSESWANARYSKELGRLNKSLEPLTMDLFQPQQEHKPSEKIFVVAAVIEDAKKAELPQIFFVVPYSTLTGHHYRAPLAVIQQIASQGIRKNELDPLPFLKKRLGESEQESMEA